MAARALYWISSKRFPSQCQARRSYLGSTEWPISCTYSSRVPTSVDASSCSRQRTTPSRGMSTSVGGTGLATLRLKHRRPHRDEPGGPHGPDTASQISWRDKVGLRSTAGGPTSAHSADCPHGQSAHGTLAPGLFTAARGRLRLPSNVPSSYRMQQLPTPVSRGERCQPAARRFCGPLFVAPSIEDGTRRGAPVRP